MLLRPNVGGSWALLVLLALLQEPGPACAWYKHAASRRYHTVGRASGLLMGVRRSPYMWRRQEGEVDPALTLGLDQAEGSQAEQGGETGPEEKDIDRDPAYVMATRVLAGLERDIQPPNNKPNGKKPDMGGEPTSKGDREKAAVHAPLNYILTLHNSWNPEDIGRKQMPNPLLSRFPEEPSMDTRVPLGFWLPEGTRPNKDIGESTSKRTPEETGMDTAYDGISIQERSIGGLKKTPNQYILALYRKLKPEESDLDNNMDNKLTLQESGAGRDIEITKQYPLALYNKNTQDKPVTEKGRAKTQWYMVPPYSKQTTQAEGMTSGLMRPFSKWNPEKMYMGKPLPLTKRSPRDLIGYIIAPFTSWASERIDMVSGMQTPERTGKDRYLPSTFTKVNEEETGVNKNGLHPKWKWSQDGIETGMQPPYAYLREA